MKSAYPVIGLMILLLCSFPGMVGAQSNATTSFWTGAAGPSGNGDYLFNTIGNWNFGASNQVATKQPQIEPSGEQNVLFINQSGTIPTIQLTGNVPLATGGGNFIVQQGTFNFDLNGKSLGVSQYVLGNASSNLQNSSLTNAGLTIFNITLDGTNQTYRLSTLFSNLGGTIASNIAVNLTGGVTLEGTGNTVTVPQGDNVTPPNGAGTNIQATGTTASTNNLIDVNGGTLNGGVLTTGYYNNSNPNGIISSNDEVHVHNGGTLNGNASIDAGDELLIDGSGTFNGSLLVNPNGSAVLTGTSALVNIKAANSQIISDSGTVSLLNGAIISVTGSLGSGSALSVSAGAVFQVDGGSTFINTSLGGAAISGALKVTNGSQYIENPTAAGIGSALAINSGGILVVSGTSTLTKTRNDLAIGSGGTMQVTTGSTVTVTTFNLPPAGALTVDSSSTFTFDTLGGLAGGKGSNTLQINGAVNWSGVGGLSASSDSHGNSDVNLVLPNGTKLVLDNGDYELGSKSSTMAGSLEVASGATLSGGGTIGNTAPGTPVQFDAGSTLNLILPGNTVGIMTFGSGVQFPGTGNITINLPVLDAGLGDYGQIITTDFNPYNLSQQGTLVFNPQLDSNLAADLKDNLPPGTTFQFFASDDDGDPVAVPSSYGVTVTAGSRMQLAKAGLQWDATNFYTQGVLGIAAISSTGLRLPSTNLDLWRQQHFGAGATNSGNAADTATPSHDGVSNLMKYATGQDPNSLGTQPGTVTKSSDGLNLIFTYTRNPAADGEVQETVQWSTDMQTWSTTGITEVVTPQTVTSELVTDTVPIGSNTRMYMELVVSR